MVDPTLLNDVTSKSSTRVSRRNSEVTDKSGVTNVGF